MKPNKFCVREIVEQALREDLGTGDLTSEYLLETGQIGSGRLIAKEDGVIAGLEIAEQVWRCLDEQIRCHIQVEDGQPVVTGQVLAQVSGNVSSILKGERVALNFVQRLSGIATLTARCVEKVRGLPVFVVDTRKTTPGLRILEKYAVRVGGGRNHRFGLYDAVLLKENHLRAAGGIKPAVEKLKKRLPFTCKIEVEVETLAQVEEALAAGVDIILLDNMTMAQMREAVSLVGGKVLVEASGGITLDNLRQVAETGVDFISMGALTHSAKALDISFLLDA